MHGSIRKEVTALLHAQAAYEGALRRFRRQVVAQIERALADYDRDLADVTATAIPMSEEVFRRDCFDRIRNGMQGHSYANALADLTNIGANHRVEEEDGRFLVYRRDTLLRRDIEDRFTAFAFAREQAESFG